MEATSINPVEPRSGTFAGGTGGTACTLQANPRKAVAKATLINMDDFFFILCYFLYFYSW